MGTVIQMYSAVVPADGMASIDVPHDGKLVGVDWAIRALMAGADTTWVAQLSFGSTGQFAVNDTRSVISVCSMYIDLTTSGAGEAFVNKFVILPNIAVGMGERIYLHGAGTAVVGTLNVCLHFDFELDRAQARRR